MVWINYIEDEVKQQLNELPKSYKNISGFNNASEEFVNNHNWYELEDVVPNKEEWQKIVDNGYVLENNIVIKKYISNNISLEDYKEQKKNYIKNKLNEDLENGFISTNSIKLDCNEKSVTSWANAITVLELNGHNNVNIRDYDNNIINITYEDFKILGLELGNYYMSLFNKKWTLQYEIDNKTSYEEVFSVEW